MSEPQIGKSSRKIVWVLVILPVWLVGSTLVGLWLWTKDSDPPEPAKFVTEIDQKALAIELSKVIERVGPRHTGSEAGRTGLRRMAALIEGTLGPDNAGYRVERVLGPVSGEDSWPIILATLPGGDAEPLWVLAAYDQDPAGGGVEANATGVVSILAVAQAIGGDKPDRPVVFAFLPHGYDAEAPVGPMVEVLNRKRGDLDRMLVVEAMGQDGGGLIASSRSGDALGHPAIDAHTKVVGSEAVCLTEDHDLASVLFEAGNPTVRISTRSVVRAEEPDIDLPDPVNHARATILLADLIRGLANVPE